MTWPELARIAAVARGAGAAILDASRAPLETRVKADRSPVSLADQAAHATITAGLAALDPDVPIVSEEGEVPEYAARRHWPRFWLVDPLDGTKEFLGGSGEYTVNIALIEGDEPILGVVYAPAMDVMYLGARGLGAWKEAGEAPREAVWSSPPPARPLVVVESRSHPSEALEAYLTTIAVKARVQAGSSLKFCWVAEGKADVYPRFGRTMEWDTAAGDCIYRQSGRDGERRSPLRYNTPSLSHEPFVIGLG